MQQVRHLRCLLLFKLSCRLLQCKHLICVQFLIYCGTCYSLMTHGNTWDLMLYLRVNSSYKLIHLCYLFTTGIPNTVNGIMDIIQQAKQCHQKRAYPCIKLLVNIFHMWAITTDSVIKWLMICIQVSASSTDSIWRC